MIRNALLLCFCMTVATPAFDDLESIKKESSPDRQQQRALDLMESLFRQAQDELRDSSPPKKVQATLDQVADAAEFSLNALRESGKKASKMTKQYKRGDLRTRELIRKMESFIVAMQYDDRPAAEKTKVRLQVVAEEYLLGAMSKN